MGLDSTTITLNIRWWLAVFSNKVLLIKMCTIQYNIVLKDNVIADNRDYSLLWT